MKKLIQAIGYTLLLVIIFRIGAHVPVPGVNAQAIYSLTNSDAFSLLNLFNGGALTSFSLFAMGVSPYITASIVVQLLQMDLVPALVEWTEQGEVGRKKSQRLMVVLSVILGFLQAFGLAVGFNNYSGTQFIENPSLGKYLFIAFMLTVGSTILTLLGEYVNDRGIGSGISTLIFAGIVSRIPSEFFQSYTNGHLYVTLAVFVGLTIIMIFFEQSQLRIPMYYSKKTSGELMTSWIPLKVNSAGVIPVIFASSVFSMPSLIQVIFLNGEVPTGWVQFVFECFNLGAKKGIVTYAVLVMLFTFFYSYVQINPERMAENLQKSSGYIVGVRPGVDTEKFVTRKLNHLNIIGAIYLTAIAAIPIAQLLGIPQSNLLSGTSLLIVIGVAIEMYRQILGKYSLTNYKGLFVKS